MPIYFFDIDDGDRQLPDQIGSECKDLKTARDDATSVIAEIAKDAVLRDRRTIVVHVRDESSQAVLMVALTLETKWLN